MCRNLILLFLLFAPVLAVRHALAQTSSFQPSPYVYKIHASECPQPPEQRTLTGFRVRNLRGIVTALHGVVGCKVITAQPGGEGEPLSDLIVGKVDIAHDVALLWSPVLARLPAAGLPALASTGDAAADYQNLTIVGYPHDVNRQRPILDVRIVEKTALGDLLPNALIPAIKKRASPAINTQVFNVQAAIVPGHSGAPLLNGAGKVVGVGNGGIDLGRTDMTWAIPWQAIVWKTVSPKVSQQVSWDDVTALSALEVALIEGLFSIETPVTPTPMPTDTPVPTPQSTMCPLPVDPDIAAHWSPDLGCALGPTRITWASFSAYERGMMMWRDDTKLIYGFFDGNGWKAVVDRFVEGMPDMPNPNRGEPPPGLIHPIRGTGLVWASDDEFFQNLGWARVQQKGFCAKVQDFTNGFVLRESGLGTCLHSNGQTLSSRATESDFEFRFVRVYHTGEWQR